MFLPSLVFKLCAVFFIVEGARILVVSPVPSYSHQQVLQAIWRELSINGHQVTALTTNPIKDSSLINLTEFDMSFSYDLWRSKVDLLLGGPPKNFLKIFYMFQDLMLELLDKQLKLPEVKRLINDNSKFDLVIVELLSPIPLAFARRFNCPLIGVLTIDAFSQILQLFGSPSHPILYPDPQLGYVSELSFAERVTSFLSECIMPYTALPFKSTSNEIVREHFGVDFPSIDELEKSIDMLFINSEPILNRVRPLVPTVIQIGGGIHIRPPKPLRRDLQKTLDATKDIGFIYFSLGSNIKSDFVNDTVIKMLLDTFAELSYTVLWKFDSPKLPSIKPENVVISKWFPQQDILRHPSIKLFITQGGYQSLEEAFYNQVPVLLMPFFGDQHFNARLAFTKGFGKYLDLPATTKETLKSTILELIKNPRYKKKVTELSNLARDQPMTGLEKAVWWSEYVIRNKGTKHLRSAVLDLPAYQYYFMDVIAFYTVAVIVTFYILKFLCKACCYCLCSCFS